MSSSSLPLPALVVLFLRLLACQSYKMASLGAFQATRFFTPALQRSVVATKGSNFALSALYLLQYRSSSREKLFVSQLETTISSNSSSFNCDATVVKQASLVICGPSGVGKGTIINKFMTEMGGSQNFGFSCSHTTRKPRPGEVDGVHYHFSDMAEMKRGIQEGKFLEWAQVHDNLYGTSFESVRRVQEEGKICLLDIDVQGVQKIKKDYPDFEAYFVFIAPPSKEVLKDRLAGRGTETPESLERRTKNAIAELEYGLTPGNFHRIIVNDELAVACQDLDATAKELYHI